MEKNQSVGNLERKLSMLRRQLTLCLENFHDPLSFVTQVDSMIQSLRNFTFAVQANKDNIPNFEKWYIVWQNFMKQDEYLKWLHNMRTDVVHKDVLTTESHAVLTHHVDHLISANTVHFDVMTPTKEMIDRGVKAAETNPELRHSTGIIDRYYLFSMNEKPVDTVHVLMAALDFMERLYIDLLRYLSEGTVKEITSPPLSEFAYESPEALTVRFKLKDGSILNERVIRFNRDENIEAIAEERYGKFKLKHNLKSKSYKEYTRGQFEIAEKIFNNDGFHIPMMQVHNKKGWSMVSPVFKDRAEKIYFFKGLAERVKSQKIDKILFTTEAWTYGDLNKGLKHITAGKEIKTLRNKGEVLETYYIDSKGRFFVISAPILRTPEDVKVGVKEERSENYESMPIFAGIFQAWGLLADSGDND